MTLPDLRVVSILPLVVWIMIGVVTPRAIKLASRSKRARGVVDEPVNVQQAAIRRTLGLVAFFVVIVGVVAWSRSQGSDALRTTLSRSGVGILLVHGFLLGLVLVGALLLLRVYSPVVRKGSLMMIGVQPSALVRAAELMTMVFAEELWRAVCLKALVGSGNSGAQALVMTSIAYGLAFLVWSPSIAASEFVVGMVLGGIFLWSGSLLVPLAAHATLNGFIQLVSVAASPDSRPGRLHRKAFAMCPVCRKGLAMRQVNANPNEAFRCPYCNARITVSDSRRWVARWGFTFVMLLLMVGFWSMLPGALTGSKGEFFLSLVLVFCTGNGLWILINVLYPPKLEYGDPDFVGLNLTDRKSTGPSDKQTTEPRAPDPDEDESRARGS